MGVLADAPAPVDSAAAVAATSASASSPPTGTPSRKPNGTSGGGTSARSFAVAVGLEVAPANGAAPSSVAVDMMIAVTDVSSRREVRAFIGLRTGRS